MLHRIFLIVLLALQIVGTYGQGTPVPFHFTWEGAVTGNRAVWAVDDSINIYKNLGGVDLTLRLIDPLGKNTDSKNPSDYGDFTKTNGFFGRGSLAFQITSTEINQDVCFSFEFSKSVTISKFNIWDIDMLQSSKNNFSTYQDNVNIYAYSDTGRVKMNIMPLMDKPIFDIFDQNIKAKFIAGVNNDVLHTDSTAAIRISSPVAIDRLVICNSNGSDDDGLSNSHAVRFSDFEFNEAFGSIEGSVFEDLTKQPLSGSLITLLDDKGNPAYNKNGDLMEIVTGLDGTYKFPLLPVGKYIVLQKDLDGYESVSDVDGDNDNMISVDLKASNLNVIERNFVDKLSSPLPVKLTNLKAVWVRDVVCGVSWTTASEVNNHYFEVLISKDGVEYQPVAKAFSIGNHNQTHNYYVECENPYDGVSYVKLVQYDLDGKSSQLGVVSLRNAHEATFSIHPNPVSMMATLTYTSKDDTPQSYQVLNANGMIVQAGVVSGNETSLIDFSQLPSGIYYFQMYIGGKNVTRKVVKQ